MGDNVKAPQITPQEWVGFLNRVMQLGPGVHTVVLIKTGKGKNGLSGWAVYTVKLEGAGATIPLPAGMVQEGAWGQ